MPQIKDIAITKEAAEDGDLVIMQNPSTGETYNITIVNLLARFLSGSNSNGGNDGGGNSGNSNPSTVALAFASAGDINGLFYYLGTVKRTVAFSSPDSRGVILSANGTAYGAPNVVVNRNDDFFYPPEDPGGAWITFHLTDGALKCNYYSIKTRSNYGGYYLRNWKFQGSTDGSTWIDLDVQNNNTTLNSDGQWLALPVVDATVAYHYFRLITTGADSSGAHLLVLNEVELYGSYS